MWQVHIYYKWQNILNQQTTHWLFVDFWPAYPIKIKELNFESRLIDWLAPPTPSQSVAGQISVRHTLCLPARDTSVQPESVLLSVS